MPQSGISRCEVAAITTRIADATLRKEVVLKAKPIPVTGILLDKTSLSLTVGRTAQLTASVAPENATDKSVVWSSSSSAVTVSSSGLLTAKYEGSAIITAKAGDKTASCSVTSAMAPLVYTGRGDSVIRNINLPKGVYYVEFTHNGSSNFIAKLYYGEKSLNYNLVANTIGVSSGRMLIDRTLKAAISDGMMEIDADGNWTISINKLTEKSSSNLSGNGDWVSGFFVANTSRAVTAYSNSGDSNFIVQVMQANGNYALGANDIGPCSGSKVISLTKGATYFLEIRADGDWTFDTGLGESRQAIGPVTKPESGSTSSTGDYFNGGDIIYYDGFEGVPDFGAMCRVSPCSNYYGEGGYMYKSSEVYAAAGPNAVSDYINLLYKNGFGLGAAYDGGVILANNQTGVRVSIYISTISSGEYIDISVYYA